MQDKVYLFFQVSGLGCVLISTKLFSSLRVDVLLLLDRGSDTIQLYRSSAVGGMVATHTSRGPAQDRPMRKICLYKDTTLARAAVGI